MKISADYGVTDLAAFVATVEDAELAQLTDEYRALETARTRLAQRAGEIKRDLATVNAKLLGAVGKPRQELMAQRRALLDDQELLPVEQAHLLRQHAYTRLNWLQRVRALAIATFKRLDAEAQAFTAQQKEHTKTIDRIDRQRATSHISRDEGRAQTAVVMEQRKAIAAQAMPTVHARDKALLVAKVAQRRAEMAYGSDVELDGRHTWEPAIERAIMQQDTQRRASVVRASWQAV